MMNIYTDYYSHIAKVSTSALLVQVSNTAPDWFSKPLYKPYIDVSPSWRIINAYKEGRLPYEEFCNKYRDELLGRTTINDILIELEEALKTYGNGSDRIILLCWEADGNACHRTFLASLLSGVMP